MIETPAKFLITYPDNLPVSQDIQRIKDIVANNQVTIICGETGSGKTTQLPKMLLDMGYAENGLIGHTQPRKVAAKTLAKRIGEELKCPELVGHKVRFQDRTSAATCIKLMTDGILLQEIQTDKLLKRYSAIIVDEAHERSLNIDFILGYLKTILNRRPDLKIIITSATIDNQKLSKFFYDAPIVSVEGKTYPVDIVYQKLANDGEDIVNLNDAIYRAIQACFDIDAGNVLVFLPGEREIKDCISFLRKSSLRNCLLLPLFSRQNEQEQSQIFTEDGHLKIIVTTNVAETSLTIPGIRYVIDSGLARVKRYNSRLKVEQLLVENIAKANSQQRAGRAGRVSHGMCIRLFGQDEFNQRQPFADPEILRSNLANVILKLISFKLGDPLSFPFLDMPENKAFNDGFKTLFQLGALDENNNITPTGRHISQIPLDSNLARMLIAGGRSGSLKEILIIVAFLAIVDPRQYPMEWQQQAQQKHQVWADKQSDFIAILNLWQWYQNEIQHKKSRKKLIEICHTNFLSFNHLREWHELHGQLKEVMHNLEYKESDSDSQYEHIHKALLTGLLNNIGQKDLVENFYLGTNTKKFLLHPNSTVNKAKWIVSANLMQTTRLYGRTNAYIEPVWLVPLTKHLVKYTYGDENWDKKRGEVVAMQSTLLLGLQIERKKVSFSHIDAKRARELFISQGLVPGEVSTIYPFIIHNQSVIKQIDELEDKLRFSLVIAEDELFKFYERIIPHDIYDIKTFEVWHKLHGESLKLKADEFVQLFNLDDESINLYPDVVLVDNEQIKLKYIFNPENTQDGVTALIQLNQLNRIDAAIFSWLVPGLIREKLSYAIKALPKNIRVQLNPVNDCITNFLKQADTANDFADEFSQHISKLLNLKVDAHFLYTLKYPVYLTFHYQVYDGKQLIDSGDNLSEIKLRLAPQFDHIVTSIGDQHEILDIKEWQDELRYLLSEVTFKRNKHDISAYRCLNVRQDKVNLTLADNLLKATTSTKKGLLYLVRYQLHMQIKYLEQKQLANFKQISLYLSDVYNSTELLQDCVNQVLRMSVDLTSIPKSTDEFTQLVALSRAAFTLNTGELSAVLFDLAKVYQQLKLNLTNHPLEEDILLQLDDLIYPDFLKHTNYTYLLHFPRYLQAMVMRLERYNDNPRRDRQLADEVTVVYEAWYNYVDKLEASNVNVPNSVYAFKFKIEELRVSLFAQELKTPTPVSSKRLFKELESFSGFATLR